MTDDQIAALFAQGSTPERDRAFAERVAKNVARLGWLERLMTAARAAALFAVAVALFFGLRALEPIAAPVLAWTPELMGVPAPLVLAAIAVAVTIQARRIFARRAGR